MLNCDAYLFQNFPKRFYVKKKDNNEHDGIGKNRPLPTELHLDIITHLKLEKFALITCKFKYRF